MPGTEGGPSPQLLNLCNILVCSHGQCPHALPALGLGPAWLRESPAAYQVCVRVPDRLHTSPKGDLNHLAIHDWLKPLRILKSQPLVSQNIFKGRVFKKAIKVKLGHLDVSILICLLSF